jgi:hypothetical protein
MPRKLVLTLCSLGLLLALSAVAKADPLVLSSSAQGWYKNDGTNNGVAPVNQPAANNYFVGASSGQVLRNYFVFDLTYVTGITSAQLRLFRPGDSRLGSDPSETYVLYAVQQNPAVLGTQAGVAIYDDLGSGTVYAEITLPTPNFFGNSFVTIDLNAEALAAIQSSSGGLFAIGGAVTTLRTPTVQFGSEGLFGGSFGTAAQLLVNGQTVPTPEPATMLLLATGVGGLLAAKVRRAPRAHR